MISLQDRNWAPFVIENLFECNIAKAIDYGKTIRGGNVFVGRQSKRNGIQGFVSNPVVEKGNCISIAMVGESKAFYQKRDFVASQNILVLRNSNLNKNISLFLNNSIQKQLFKYNYGKPISLKNFKKQLIMLPINSNYEPDYIFMESYMNQVEHEYLNKIKNKIVKELKILGKYNNIVPLNEKKFLPFKLGNIGVISSGKDIYQDERIEGRIPYITSGTSNNGIGYFVSNMNNTYDNNYVSINRNGAVGESFYHNYYSLLGNDCRKFVLKTKDRGNKYIYLFICTVIAKQKGCFSYSRKLGTERAKNLNIMLPVKRDDTPDYNYMEQYIKNVMINKYNKFLKFIDR